MKPPVNNKLTGARIVIRRWLTGKVPLHKTESSSPSSSFHVTARRAYSYKLAIAEWGGNLIRIRDARQGGAAGFISKTTSKYVNMLIEEAGIASKHVELVKDL